MNRERVPSLKPSAVKTYRDGREVCNDDTAAGRAEYARRREEMWERDKGICCICLLYVPKDEAPFEHWLGRGSGGGHRDDRTEKPDSVTGEMKKCNGIAHSWCNGLKGSKRMVDIQAQAYENTEVPVSRSQEAIRKMVMSHGGFGFAAVSERELGLPAREGFHAKVMIDQKPYAVRIMATVKPVDRTRSERQRADFTEREERRIWRVIYYHLKSVFEASDSGVMEFRELMLPYIQIADGRTVAEIILPNLDMAITSNHARLLTVGSEPTA